MSARTDLVPMLAILLASTLILGFRTCGVARAVLRGPVVKPITLPITQPSIMTEITRDDALLAAVEAPSHDPFAGAEAPSVPSSATEAPAPVVIERPVLRAFLYDDRQPTIQVAIGEQTSGWLRAGDKFQGWTVTDINATAATLSRNGQSVVLP